MSLGNEIVTIALMGTYTFGLAIVWAVFEKRLRMLHYRHVEKCAPFGQRGLEKLDGRLIIVIRMIMLGLLMISLGIIYFMT